jgi:hypothetical protein
VLKGSAAVGQELLTGVKDTLKSGGSISGLLSGVFGSMPEIPTPFEAALGKKGAESYLKKHKKELSALQQAFGDMDKLNETMKTAKAALMEIGDASKQISGVYKGATLTEAGSDIISALGKEGNLSSAISMLAQLGASADAAYDSLISVAKGGQKKALIGGKNATSKYVEAMKSEVAGLMIRRQEIETALGAIEKTYNDKTDAIAAAYDPLEKAAENSLKSLKDKWDAAIPPLEKALEAANAAFDKENDVLKTLISDRDSFLKSIGDGFRSFANNLSNTTKSVIKITQDLGNGMTLTTDKEVTDASSFRTNLEDRLASIKEFGANIRSLLARGLDASLVKDFVSAGVDSAGSTVAALAGSADSELAAINAAQTALAAEVSSFQSTASAQWFNAGIAQQEAVVAPLRAAAAAAQFALDLATQTRDRELKDTQAHLDALKAARETELASALSDYNNQKVVLQAEMNAIDSDLATRAASIQKYFTDLMDPKTGLPPQMLLVGKAAMNGLIAGIDSRKDAVLASVRAIAVAAKNEMQKVWEINSPSRVAATIGEQIADGLIQGLAGSEGAVRAAASSLAANVMLPTDVPSMDSLAPSMGAMGISSGVGGGVMIQNSYEVNVQSLAGDKRQIGREVVEAIRAFERTSGPVYMPAG